MWSLALNAPVAVVVSLLLAGSASAIVASGWVRDRSTAERDAVARLGWPSAGLLALRVVEWAMFGLFVAAAVVLLAK